MVARSHQGRHASLSFRYRPNHSDLAADVGALSRRHSSRASPNEHEGRSYRRHRLVRFSGLAVTATSSSMPPETRGSTCHAKPTATPKKKSSSRTRSPPITLGWPKTDHCFFQARASTSKTTATATPASPTTDARITVQATQLSGPTTAPYGIVYRVTSLSDFYGFEVSGNGYMVRMEVRRRQLHEDCAHHADHQDAGRRWRDQYPLGPDAGKPLRVLHQQRKGRHGGSTIPIPVATSGWRRARTSKCLSRI